MKLFIVGCLALFALISLRAQSGPIISEFMASNSKTLVLAPANWQAWQQVVSAPTNRTVTLTNSPAGPGGRFFRIVTPAMP